MPVGPSDCLRSMLYSESGKIQKQIDPAVRSVFVVEPVSPIRFLEDPRYYVAGEEVWTGIKEIMEQIFSGKYYFPAYHTVVFSSGIGSGKSFCYSLCVIYVLYLLHCLEDPKCLFPNISRGDRLAFMNLGPTEEQAKDVMFNKIWSALSKCPIFQEKNWGYEDHKRHIEFSVRNLLLKSGNSSKIFPVGANLFGGCVDEAGHFQLKSGEDPCKDLYDTLNDRRDSRFGDQGLIFLCDSDTSSTCFMEELHERAESDPKILSIRRSFYDLYPDYVKTPAEDRFDLTVKMETFSGKHRDITLHPPKKLQPRYEYNFDEALRKIDAIPLRVAQPFYQNWERVLAMVNRDRKDPVPDLGDTVSESPLELQARLPLDFVGQKGIKYFAHVDLATGDVQGGKCGCGLALSHLLDKQGPRVSLDLAVRFKAPSGREVEIATIREFLMWLYTARGFDFSLITFDQWQSRESIQTLRGKGYTAANLAVGRSEHVTVRSAIYEGRVDMFYDDNLFLELKGLQDGGTIVVAARMYFKDEADALVGSVYSALTSDEVATPSRPRPMPRSFQSVNSGRRFTGAAAFRGSGWRESGGSSGMPRWRNT